MNSLINKKQRSLFVLLAFALIFSCNKDKSPTKPENTGVYAGYWEGTTGHNKPIYFHVTEDGIVGPLAIRLRMDFATMYCIAYFISDKSAEIANKSFEVKAKLPSEISNIFTTVSSNFMSEDSAAGSYTGFSGQFYLICGSSYITGTGSILDAGSWSASKISTAPFLKPRLNEPPGEVLKNRKHKSFLSI
ncbi:MAG: hypothetical protein GXO75_00395 [Calditrichaeota bacterium]|nr:hypothetical protein [Calditrichota bacterium]